MNVVIKQGNNPIAILHGETLASLRTHLERGYPELVEEFVAGRVSGEEVEDVSGVVVVPRQEIEYDFQRKMLRAVEKVLFNHENRIRVLEGKPALTADQFRAAVRAALT